MKPNPMSDTITMKQIYFAFDLVAQVSARCKYNGDQASGRDLVILETLLSRMVRTLENAEWQFREKAAKGGKQA